MLSAVAELALRKWSLGLGTVFKGISNGSQSTAACWQGLWATAPHNFICDVSRPELRGELDVTSEHLCDSCLHYKGYNWTEIVMVWVLICEVRFRNEIGLKLCQWGIRKSFQEGHVHTKYTTWNFCFFFSHFFYHSHFLNYKRQQGITSPSLEWSMPFCIRSVQIM